MRIRIGIATGFCTVGNFGSSSQLTYTILGTTVNLASRIEFTGIAGSVVVSEETEYLVRDRFCCSPRAPLPIKGILHPVNSWQIIDDLQQALSALIWTGNVRWKIAIPYYIRLILWMDGTLRRFRSTMRASSALL